MTVQQLIDRLKELPPDATIEIPIQSYTQKYPAVYVRTEDWKDLRFRVVSSPASNRVRLLVDTPEGVIISNKNKH